MIRRITGQLPTWARADHPVMRYELGKTAARPSWRVRYARALGVVLLGGFLLLIGYLLATDLLRRPSGQNPVESLNNVVYWPLLGVQLLLRVLALALTVNLVAEEQRRQNWDNLRATESGAELAMRARWASVFYRLRGLLGLIIGVRVVLIGCILWDLTAFQGRYLDLLIAGITPTIPLVAAVLLLSFLMTAALLLPLTGVGFDASLGLLISAGVQQRTYSALLQGLIVLLRFAVTGVLLWAVGQYLEGGLILPEGAASSSDLIGWLLIFLSGAVGDWGLAFLYLGRFGEIWATVPYGIFLGLALLVFALLQAAAADQLLLLAVRRAQRKG